MRYAKHPERALGYFSLIAFSFVVTWLAAGSVEAATPYWRSSHDRLTVITNGSAARCERLVRTTLRYEQLLIELNPEVT